MRFIDFLLFSSKKRILLKVVEFAQCLHAELESTRNKMNKCIKCDSDTCYILHILSFVIHEAYRLGHAKRILHCIDSFVPVFLHQVASKNWGGMVPVARIMVSLLLQIYI